MTSGASSQQPKLSLWRRVSLFLAVLGPGIITGSVDNDAGGITTYSIAGAAYGYNLLWTMIPSFFVLFIVQEMNARLGIVTGKGLVDLIRETFGLKITFLIFMFTLVANIGNTATEFAGVAGSMKIFGISKYLSVPVVAVAVWLLAVRSNYKTAERVFLVFSVSLLSYVISAVLAQPHWEEIGRAVINPDITFNRNYLVVTVGIVGTTIAPWMQFYMQSSVIEKGLRIEHYGYLILDVLVGCIATVVVAFFIMVACGATLHPAGIQIEQAEDAARALQPLAGAFAAEVFAFGLLVASVFSAIILPLTTAFLVCEAFGFEAGIDKKLHEAPKFYGLFTAIIVISVFIVLIPNAPLIKITLWTQVVNGVLLPVVLVAMMVLINNKDIMGEYVNKPFVNFVGWATVIILSLMSLGLLVI